MYSVYIFQHNFCRWIGGIGCVFGIKIGVFFIKPACQTAVQIPAKNHRLGVTQSCQQKT